MFESLSPASGALSILSVAILAFFHQVALAITRSKALVWETIATFNFTPILPGEHRGLRGTRRLSRL
jgi:hypothetical protein